MSKRSKKGGSNRKGAAFERKVCKELSLWVSNGTREDLFWRTAMSGGRATVARKAGRDVRQGGDVCAVDQLGHDLTSDWYIECKAYRKIDLEGFLVKSTGRLSRWWQVCKKEAKHYQRDPMLIVKQNGWPWLVITKHNHVAHWTAARFSTPQVDVCLFTDLVRSKFAQGARA